MAMQGSVGWGGMRHKGSDLPQNQRTMDGVGINNRWQKMFVQVNKYTICMHILYMDMQTEHCHIG